jgi:hypothetical protein
MTTDTEIQPNTVELPTKYGALRLTAWDNKATVTAGGQDDRYQFAINRIPYSFTMHLKRETVDYAGEPYDTPYWKIDGAGVYIRRLDTQYGLGEPTQGARTVIYNELRDLCTAYLDEHADFMLEGRKAALLSAITGYERDLIKLTDDMNQVHDRIREAREEYNGL